MKRTLKTGFAILLVMSVVIGNIPFAAMMVCVHANDIHGEKAVHLHYGQLPGQPCHESADSAKVANATTAGRPDGRKDRNGICRSDDSRNGVSRVYRISSLRKTAGYGL